MFTDLPLFFYEKYYYVNRDILKVIIIHRYIKVFYIVFRILYIRFSENSTKSDTYHSITYFAIA